MKIKFLILSILTSIIFFNCKPSSKSATLSPEEINKAYEKIENDSVKTFYNFLFDLTKKEYLYKNEINIDSAITITKKELAQAKTFDDALKQLPNYFDAINCNHCSLFYGRREIYPNIGAPSDSLFSKGLKDKFKTMVDFEAKVLDNKYGYISIPPVFFQSFVNEEKLNKVSAEFYNKINEIKSKNNINGWIVDLRLNQGGIPYPMILSMYDFLGDAMVFQYLDDKKSSISQVQLEKGKLIDEKGLVAKIEPKGKMLTDVKVAVLTSPATASAGEIVAICFKGRPNTTFIGENSTGLTTVNSEVIMPYNGNLAFTVGYDADRNGKTYKFIKPDIEVLKQDNFKDLLQDKKVQKAIEFFNE